MEPNSSATNMDDFLKIFQENLESAPPLIYKKNHPLWQTHGIDINSTYSKVYSETPPTHPGVLLGSIRGSTKSFQATLKRLSPEIRVLKIQQVCLKEPFSFLEKNTSDLCHSHQSEKLCRAAKAQIERKNCIFLKMSNLLRWKSGNFTKPHCSVYIGTVNLKPPFQTHCKVTTWRIFGYLLGFTRLLGH